jgi:hypothetical protein
LHTSRLSSYIRRVFPIVPKLFPQVNINDDVFDAFKVFLLNLTEEEIREMQYLNVSPEFQLLIKMKFLRTFCNRDMLDKVWARFNIYLCHLIYISSGNSNNSPEGIYVILF